MHDALAPAPFGAAGRGRGRVVPPGRIVAELRGLDPHLREEAYYSERALFYNPRGAAPLGVIFCALKDHDGPNDARSRLSRPGVFRLAFQLSRDDYERRFGSVPSRPPKGAFVEVGEDVSALDVLTPHPVYAWMRWVQILRPSRSSLDELTPLFEASLADARSRWRRRKARV